VWDDLGKGKVENMKCPYCNKDAKISNTVKLSLESYGGSARARTDCCKAIIRVYPIVIYRCEETDQVDKDDWGN
jgi:hypothetical protein